MKAQSKARTTAEQVLRTSRPYEIPDTYVIEELQGHEFYDDRDQWCCVFPDGSAVRLQDNVGLAFFWE